LPLSLSEFTEVIGEITPVLTGGWIQKVHQPFPDAITLEVRTPGQTYILFLSANAQTARLHLLSRRLPNPPEPPPFCQFLRASIQGYRIEQVEQVLYDRIVTMKVQGPDTALYLVTALTGRQANLFLLDRGHLVLRSLKPGPVKVGQPYHPPQRSLATQHARQGKSHSAEAKQESPRTPSVKARRVDRFPVSLFLEEKYLGQEEENARQHLQQERTRTLCKAVKKTRRRIDALSLDLEKAHRFREYGRYGELLKNHLGTLSKGQAEITVVDYFDESLPPFPFVLNLITAGWIIGILTTSIIMRFGQQAEVLAWGMVFLFQPISCVFYPLEVLPGWLQAIALVNPAAHVFEGMREILSQPNI